MIMNTQSPEQHESLRRQPTGPEVSRKHTVYYATLNIEQALKSIEKDTVEYLKPKQVIVTKPQENLNMPQPESAMASFAVESSSNDETAARDAVEEVFKNAN